MRWTPALVLVLFACAPEPTEVRLSLVPAQAIGCQPTAVETVLLRPLGDSPAEARPSHRLDLSRVSTIDAFAPSTEQVSVRAEGVIARTGGGQEPWLGGGLALLGGGDELIVPLLRLRRGCALSDTRAGVPPGAAVTELADGRLLIAGGDRGLEDLRLVIVRSGDPLARTVDLRARPRVEGTATALDGDRVLVAGGIGRESFEIVALDAEAVVSEGLLRGPRSAHDALRLSDGRVLLVGGRSETGAARRDAELIELDDDGTARRTRGELAVGRIAPRILGLDDGTVLVVGGVDDAGAPVATIERFDPETESFTSLGAPWPALADAAYVALPGGRAARIGGREAAAWSRAVSVLLDRGQTHVSLGAVLRAVIERPRAVSLGDGRVLVIGSAAGAPTAQVLDPGASRDALEASRERIEGGRAPSHLVRLVDGVIALLDANGVSLLRVDLSGPFDDPSASISPAQTNQREELSLDAPDRWRGAGDVLVAEVDGARFELPSSRFADVRVELSSVGSVELLLTIDGAAPAAIRIDEAQARLGDCAVAIDGPLIAERIGSELRLASGGQSQTCALDVRGRVGVAVRATAGGGVRRLAVTRL